MNESRKQAADCDEYNSLQDICDKDTLIFATDYIERLGYLCIIEQIKNILKGYRGKAL